LPKGRVAPSPRFVPVVVCFSAAARARFHPADFPSHANPGSPAWSDGASAAKMLSNPPRIVLEPFSKDPARFPEGSAHRPHRPRSPLARLDALAGVTGVV
jgi:hypothetical protein